MPLPPDQAAVSAYTHAKEFERATATMLAQLASRTDEQDRRIAALEAQAADRRTRGREFVEGMIGLFVTIAGGVSFRRA
jgi:predicted transcriptional regulator